MQRFLCGKRFQNAESKQNKTFKR